MVERFKYYFNIAFKRYHFIIPFSVIKNFFKNRFRKGYYAFKVTSYHKWLKRYYPAFYKRDLKYKPLISVIIPVYNVKRKYLVACLESALNQSYENFEICIVDDASTLKETLDTLKEYENNKKIKIKYHKKNAHISKTSNDAISMAKGEFIALLDNDDLIDENALYEMVQLINEHLDADLIYSDEDKVTANGKFFHTPIFKPDYSPDYLLNTNYICHFTIIRKSIFDKVGGFRLGYEGVQDWDLFIRVIKETNNVYHIPRILYHWRELETSTALNVKNKPYVIERTKKLVEEEIIEHNLDAEAVQLIDNVYNIKFNKRNEKVAIIIHGKNNIERCIENIVKNVDYSNYEIIINNNYSKKELSNISKQYKNVLVINSNKENESIFINDASKKSKGKYLLFLDSNVIIDNKDFISQLVGYASLKHIGAVGTNIVINNKYICNGSTIYNNKTIQSEIHDGINDKVGVYGRSLVSRNVLVVKDACLMIDKTKFIKMGGYDESLIESYNDIDLCIKLYSKGYYNLIEPSVKIKTDNENLFTKSEKEKDIIKEKWGKKYYKDPFYNINFDDNSVYYLRCNNYTNKKHVFIIGSRGYDFNYGGWETFVTQLINYYHSDNIIFHVSGIGLCESHQILNDHVYLDLFPLNRFGKLQMYIHTRTSIHYYEKYINQNKLNESVIYILGLKLGSCLKFYHKKLNKNGVQIMVNPDGLEWKRGKYGLIGKLYFLSTERSMLNNCDLIICDAKGIYDYIINKYKRNKIEKKIITYGTNKYTNYLKPNVFYKKYNLRKDDYLLVVGRLVPENNLSFIIKEFVKSKIPKKLVIVTNETNEGFNNWCKKEKIELNDNIVFLGSIYNEQDIYSLRYYAYAYIHGHSVGGTNPSLLESLYTTKLVIALNVNFNKDICKDSALYFNLDDGSLTKLLNKYKKFDLQREQYHNKAIKIINDSHTWEHIIKEYKDIWEGE